MQIFGSISNSKSLRIVIVRDSLDSVRKNLNRIKVTLEYMRMKNLFKQCAQAFSLGNDGQKSLVILHPKGREGTRIG